MIKQALPKIKPCFIFTKQGFNLTKSDFIFFKQGLNDALSVNGKMKLYFAPKKPLISLTKKAKAA